MKIIRCLFVLIVTLSVFACKPSVPKDVIQPGRMEDILYDYHLAEAMSNQVQPNTNYNKQLYYDAVLKKYDVTRAQFDSSMVYYQRHTERLYNIYDNINKRLMSEVGESTKSETSGKYDNLSANSDTSMVWQGANATFLLASEPFNKLSFYIKADTTYHAGDSFELGMDAQFVFQDGMRDAVALLAVRYDNDSIATQNIHLSSDSHYVITIPSFKGHKIKEIRGFIFLSQGGESTTTLKLLCLSNITLARFRYSDKIISPQQNVMGPNGPGGPNGQSGPPVTPPNGPQSESMQNVQNQKDSIKRGLVR